MTVRIAQLAGETSLSMLLALSNKRLFAYIGLVGLAMLCVVYVLCIIPVLAWFRKPIELTSACPLCGSRDFRPSQTSSMMDRFRKWIGLYPFRCRGCTKRFVRRSRGEVELASWFHAEGQPGLSPRD